MIRTLLATTALATIVATGAIAQTAPAPMAPMEQASPNIIHAEGHLASRIIGQTVYNSAGDDAENIGSINDIVIAANGDVEAVIIGVGGFLGIGRKDVAIEYDLVEWVERDGDRWVVVNTTRDALEAQEEFDVGAYRPLPAGSQIGNVKPATAEDLGAPAPATAMDDTASDDGIVAEVPAEEAAPSDGLAEAPAEEVAPTDDLASVPADDAAPADDLAQAPADDMATETDDTMTSAIDRSTLTDMPVTGMSADEFIGTTVYGANDENVGSVNDVILSQDGQVEAIIIDVGGFLGIGAKSVAVGLDNLAFLSDGDGDTYLYTQFTQEQLEAQPEYDPASFADNRDQQLLIVPAQ